MLHAAVDKHRCHLKETRSQTRCQAPNSVLCCQPDLHLQLTARDQQERSQMGRALPHILQLGQASCKIPVTMPSPTQTPHGSSSASSLSILS